MFALFFAVVLIVWVLAIARQTVGMSILSAVCWFSFALALFILGDTESAFTLGFAILAVLLCIIMFVLAFYQAFNLLKEAAAEKQRQIAEEIM